MARRRDPTPPSPATGAPTAPTTTGPTPYLEAARAWSWSPPPADGARLVFDHRPLPRELPYGGATVTYPSAALAAHLFKIWRGRMSPAGDAGAICVALADRFPAEEHEHAATVERAMRQYARRVSLADG